MVSSGQSGRFEKCSLAGKENEVLLVPVRERERDTAGSSTVYTM